MKKLIITMVLSAGMLSGCAIATSWPKQCSGDWGRMACRCKTLRLVASPVASIPLDATPGSNDSGWIVVPDCDGSVLPITVNSKNLKGCTFSR